MAIDPHSLIGREVASLDRRYGAHDLMLYALSLGYGSDPLDRRELQYVYEKQLQPAPTYPLVLGFASLRTLDLGIDYMRTVHAAQRLDLHAPLPTEGTVHCRTVISDVWDLGADKGALLRVVRTLTDPASGRLLATATMDAMCRGDGGFGGAPPPKRTAAPALDGAPDVTLDLPTLPQQALLYRLCGDFNPLHADPDVATAARFPRPILHGLATLGIAVRGLLSQVPAGSQLQSLSARFTAPFFPGETLRVQAWRAGPALHFRCSAVERGIDVLAGGEAVFG